MILNYGFFKKYKMVIGDLKELKIGVDRECSYRYSHYNLGYGKGVIGNFIFKYHSKEGQNQDTEGRTLSLIATVDKAPTGNCQIYSIGNAELILRYKNYYEIFCYIQKCVGKNILLLDVKDYVPVADVFGKSNIITCTPYSSTNGSSMCIYLINTKQLSQDINKYALNWNNINNAGKEYFIEQGDICMKAKNYAEAITNYQASFRYSPDIKYQKEQIKLATELLNKVDSVSNVQVKPRISKVTGKPVRVYKRKLIPNENYI